MASFFDTTIGQQIELQRILASAGFTDEHVARIIKEPSLASAMYLTIQPKAAPIPTNIVARVERQLARYEQIGLFINDDVRQRILAQAKEFVALSTNDHPLVTGFFGYAPDAVNRAWRHVKLPGYMNARYFDEAQPIHYAQDMTPPDTTVRLVHFYPSSYQGISPEVARIAARKDGIRLAGIECVEMIIVEPERALEWDGVSRPYPNLSALVLGTGSIVPRLYRWDDDRKIGLYDLWAAHQYENCSSPSVREC